jgi:hypothetical protein
MSSLQTRLDSFVNWPKDSQYKPEILAAAGFEHYDYPLYIDCKSCNQPFEPSQQPKGLCPLAWHCITVAAVRQQCSFISSILTHRAKAAICGDIFAKPSLLEGFIWNNNIYNQSEAFQTYESRRLSFSNWKSGPIVAHGFADHGLYYSGVYDVIKCSFCTQYREEFHRQRITAHSEICPYQFL